ncbi:hypothetical protein BH11PLA1_BH11PLA1_08160 [soil metagenome]
MPRARRSRLRASRLTLVTLLSGQPASAVPGDAPRIVRVGPALRALALARLLGTRPGDSAIADFERDTLAAGSHFDAFWCTLSSAGRPIQAALAVPSPGRTAMIFVSPDDLVGIRAKGELARFAGAPAIADRAALLRHAAAALRRDLAEPGAAPLPQFALAQALLEPDQRDLFDSFRAGGFEHLADLAYMRRDLPRKPLFSPAPLPPDAQLIPCADLPPAQADTLLARALERSYEGTLDCPALCDLRHIDDVVASHRAVGAFDPRLWRLLLVEGEAAGCVLMTSCPEQASVELVYLGLAPAARGRGLAKLLLHTAINALAGRPEKSLACAVDEANTPALNLYQGCGFKSFARRRALVCPLRGRNAGS